MSRTARIPRIIAMANMKGGVGKTTSTICTAFALSRLGRKVEVRDIDPQGSATLWASKARAAGDPLPFDVLVANRFTVAVPPSDPDTWVLVDTPPSQSDLIAAAVRRDDPVQGVDTQVERIRPPAERKRVRAGGPRAHRSVRGTRTGKDMTRYEHQQADRHGIQTPGDLHRGVLRRA